MRFTRLQNQFFASMLSLALVFTPARQAHAIVPLIALGVSAVSTAGVTFTAADLVGLATAVAGAGALAYMKLTAPDGSSIAVPLQDAVLHPAVIVPPPVAASTAAQSVSSLFVFSNASYGQCGGGYTSPYTGNDPAVPCGAALASCPNWAPQTSGSFTSATSYSCPVLGIVWNAQIVTSCPAGYTASGSTCNLTNAFAAIQDNQQTFTRSGAAYMPVSGDLIGTVQGIQGVTTTNGDSLAFIGSSTCAGCSTSSEVFQALNGGGTVMTYAVQKIDASGASYVNNQSLTLAPDGTISGTSSNNMTGALNPALSSANGGATFVAAPAGTIAASPTTTATTPALVFPTDYNREVTQTQIRDAVIGAGMPVDIAAGDVAILSNAHTARDNFVADIAAISTAPEPVAPVGFGANFSPFTPAACVPLSYTFGSSMTAGSHTVDLNLCPYVPTIQRIGAWAMYLMTAGMLFQMFTRRPEGV